MTCGSSRGAEPGAFLPALPQRPASWPRRFFLACGAALATAGCVGPAAVQPVVAEGAVRVIDQDGALPSGEAAAVLRRLAREGESPLLAHHLAHVAGALRAPLVLGNDGHLLIDGPQSHGAMFEAIAAAKDHVHLQSYILEGGEPGERLARLLADKRARGVMVKVLYDGVGSLATPPEYFRRLRADGIAVCEFNPVNPLRAGLSRGLQLNNRGHRKLLVVDGKVAFTGGVNISRAYSSGSFSDAGGRPSRKEGWRDTHIMVRGPVVHEFQRLFLDAWRRQGCGPADGEGYFPRLPRRGDQAMRLVAADPTAGQSDPYVVLLSAMGSARERMWLTYGYFVPDERTLHTLREAARRGVDVRLVLPGFSDFWAPLHAGRSHYSGLLAAGVRIFERRDALLHAKTAVIDGVWSSVGSTNLDWRSFVHNYEADVVVLDAGFARELEALFRMDQEASHEVTAAEWRRRGLSSRLLERLARAWEYML